MPYRMQYRKLAPPVLGLVLLGVSFALYQEVIRSFRAVQPTMSSMDMTGLAGIVSATISVVKFSPILSMALAIFCLAAAFSGIVFLGESLSDSPPRTKFHPRHFK